MSPLPTHPLSGCVYVDGVFFAPEEARVSALDHGFLYGDGAFESLRTYGGRPFRLEAHLFRLAQGCASLGIEGAPGSAELHALVEQTLHRAGLPDAYLRVTVTRGFNEAGLDPAGCGAPTVVVSALELRSYPAAAYEEGMAAARLWARGPAPQPPPGVKSTSYQQAVLARRTLHALGAREGFYLDQAGALVEGTFSNVFALSGRTLTTPPTSLCLAGITRAEVLSLAPTLGLEVKEAPLSPEVLSRAEELFITSSLAEVVPVVRLDGQRVGAGRPGPVAKELRGAYLARTSSAEQR